MEFAHDVLEVSDVRRESSGSLFEHCKFAFGSSLAVHVIVGAVENVSKFLDAVKVDLVVDDIVLQPRRCGGKGKWRGRGEVGRDLEYGDERGRRRVGYAARVGMAVDEAVWQPYNKVGLREEERLAQRQ